MPRMGGRGVIPKPIFMVLKMKAEKRTKYIKELKRQGIPYTVTDSGIVTIALNGHSKGGE